MKKVSIFASIILALLVVLGMAAASVYVFKDRVVLFAINNFTDYRISCASWTGNPLGRSVLTGLYLEAKKRGIAVRAAEGDLDIDGVKLLRDGTFVMKCTLTDLDLSAAALQRSGSPVSSNDILAIAFSPEHKYKVTFSVYRDNEMLKVSGIEAVSSYIRMKGDFSLDQRNKRVAIDIMISFSPAIADDLPDNILKDGLDEHGWYSTAINLQGPLVLLEALYSLTA